VSVWWRHPHDDADVESEFGPVVDGRDPTEIFIVDVDGHDVGLIQRYRLDDDPQWEQAVAVGSSPRPAVGIDYLIGEESRIGQGVGPRIIACFTDVTWERFPDVVAVVVAVQQANRRSCRALEKAGFERDWSGVLRSVDPSDAGPSHVYVRLRPIT
jgi:aminoglycoside 6'-N-acetyltransferase